MKKGLMQILIANIFGLFISLLTSFLLPKYLSLDAYAAIKTYALYLTYAGFFSLGYNDGMYLKYGGKDLNKINSEDLFNNFINYIFLILLMNVLVLIIGLALNNSIVIAFSFGITSYNILGYLKSLYQATGEFSLYGKALNIEKISVFLLNLLLLFVIKPQNYMAYIWIQVVVGYLSCLFLMYKLQKKMSFVTKFSFSIKEYFDNISSGFILMLGNFSSSFFTSLDRWFVKVLMDNSSFALYSFAASMENLINLFISPITVSLYNYFCKEKNMLKVKKIKNYIFVFGAVLIASAYPCKYILQTYLTKYEAANSVIFFLFCAQLFNVVIKGIYVNVYKSEKRQKKYLNQMILMIIVGSFLNTVFYLFYKSYVSFAAATLLTSVIWMILCEISDKKYSFSFMQYVGIFLLTAIFMITGCYLQPIIGLIIYLLSLLIILFVFYRDTLLEIYDLCITFKNSILKKKSHDKNS